MEAVQFLQKELLPSQFRNIIENTYDDVGFMVLKGHPWEYDAEKELLKFTPGNGAPKQYISLKNRSKNWNEFLKVQTNPFFNLLKAEFGSSIAVNEIMKRADFATNWVDPDPERTVEKRVMGRMTNRNPTSTLQYKHIKQAFPDTYWLHIQRDMTTFCWLHGLFHNNKGETLFVKYTEFNPIERFEDTKLGFPTHYYEDPHNYNPADKERFAKLKDKKYEEFVGPGAAADRDFRNKEMVRDATTTLTTGKTFTHEDQKITWFQLRPSEEKNECLFVVSRQRGSTPAFAVTYFSTGDIGNAAVKKAEELTTDDIQFTDTWKKQISVNAPPFIDGLFGKYLYASASNRTIQGLNELRYNNLDELLQLSPFTIHDLPGDGAGWKETEVQFTHQFETHINPQLVKMNDKQKKNIFTYANGTFTSLNGIPLIKSSLDLYLNIPFKIFYELFQESILWENGDIVTRVDRHDAISFKCKKLSSLRVSGRTRGVEKQLFFEGYEDLQLTGEPYVLTSYKNIVQDAFVLRGEGLGNSARPSKDDRTIVRKLIHSREPWKVLGTDAGFVSAKDINGVVYDHSVYPMILIFTRDKSTKGCVISTYHGTRLKSVAIYKKNDNVFWLVSGIRSPDLVRINGGVDVGKELSEHVLKMFNAMYDNKEGGKTFACSYYNSVNDVWGDPAINALQSTHETIRNGQDARVGESNAHTYQAYTYNYERVVVNCIGDLRDITEKTDTLQETDLRTIPPNFIRELGLSGEGGSERATPVFKQCWYCGRRPVLRERVKRTVLPKLSINIH